MALREQFITRMMPYAEEASRRTGVAPLVILAQAAHESAWGKKAPGNNFFGIKGAGQIFATHENVGGKNVATKASFRKYANPLESFLDWARLIISNPRYASVVNASTPAEQIAALGKSGYATDPKYATKLLDVANQIAVTQLSVGADAAVQRASLTDAFANPTPWYSTVSQNIGGSYAAAASTADAVAMANMMARSSQATLPPSYADPYGVGAALAPLKDAIKNNDSKGMWQAWATIKDGSFARAYSSIVAKNPGVNKTRLSNVVAQEVFNFFKSLSPNEADLISKNLDPANKPISLGFDTILRGINTQLDEGNQITREQVENMVSSAKNTPASPVLGYASEETKPTVIAASKPSSGWTTSSIDELRSAISPLEKQLTPVAQTMIGMGAPLSTAALMGQQSTGTKVNPAAGQMLNPDWTDWSAKLAANPTNWNTTPPPKYLSQPSLLDYARGPSLDTLIGPARTSGIGTGASMQITPLPTQANTLGRTVGRITQPNGSQVIPRAFNASSSVASERAIPVSGGPGYTVTVSPGGKTASYVTNSGKTITYQRDV